MKEGKKKPLGKPIEHTDEDLEKLAEISPADVKAAVKLWENASPRPLKKLLSAKVEEENEQQS